MASATETELKFDADDHFRLPRLGDLFIVRERDLELEATYWDTEVGRLLDFGVTLRHRIASDRGEDGWTLKLPVSIEPSGAVVRQELTAPGGPEAPPARFAEMVRAITLSQALQPVATVTTRRRILELGTDPLRVAVELADDEVRSTVDGVPGPTFRQIEVELIDSGETAALRAVGRRLRKAGLSRSVHRSKLERVLGAPARTLPVDLHLGSRSTLHETVGALFSRAVAHLVVNDPGVRLGEDPEAIHQARVATRRLRGELETLRPVLRREATHHLHGELRWLAALLGDVRDTQVLREHLCLAAEGLDPDEADRAELDDRLHEQCEFRRAPLLCAMSGDRYVALLTTLWAFADDPPLRRKVSADSRALPLIRRRARRSWQRVRRTATGLGDDPSDVELHELRKQVKALRYTAQSAQLVGAHSQRFAKRLGVLQDELGDLHDAVVAMAWLEEEGGLFTPTAAFLAGRLHHQSDERRRALRASWQAVWTEVDRPELRAWMH